MSTKDLKFQLIDIQSRDRLKQNIKVQYSQEKEPYKPREYCVHLFGTTAEGQSVRVDVIGFEPFFYIRLPEDSKKRARKSLETYIEKKLVRWNGAFDDIRFEEVHCENFMGFTGRTKFPFLKLIFPSNWLFREVKKLFLDEQNRACLAPGWNEKGLGDGWDYEPFNGKPQIFEANIDPLLRFIHLTKTEGEVGKCGLSTCGWVSVENANDESDPATPLIIESDWDCISSCRAPPDTATAPFLKAFWDIECYSESGEFPLAKRTWRKVAANLLDAWRQSSLRTFEDISTEIKIALTQESKILGKIWGVKILSKTIAPNSKKLGEIVSLLEKKSKNHLSDDDYNKIITELDKILTETYSGIIELCGDPVIQIGVILTRGSAETTERFLFTWKETSVIEGTTLLVYKSEKEMLSEFAAWLVEKNPDELVGYNVFGFDERYVWNRWEELGLVENDAELHGLSRMADLGVRVKLNENRLSSSALGDNFLYTWAMPGRLQVDLYHYVKRSGASLPSYKLDEVAKHYMSGKIKQVVCSENEVALICSGAVRDVRVGRFLVLMDDTGESVCHKMEVISVQLKDGKSGEIRCSMAGLGEDERETLGDGTKWAIVKDDVSPAEIFRMWSGSANDRAVVGKYCVQDCELVMELYKKLEVFNNAMSMANVCSVPLSFIFMRGQGVKIESLIFKECGEAGSLIPVLESAAFYTNGNGSGEIGETDGEKPPTEEDSYEGAIVLDPTPGFYKDSPIGVCDFASLYPSTIDSENISHDMLVWVKDYDDSGKLLENIWGSDKYAEYEGYGYIDIEFDLLRPDPADKRKNPEKIRCGRRICRYAQPLDGTKGLLPMIIRKLLATRKAKRKEAEREENPERKALLDAEQLAYKLTANSLYGQLGSKTFKIRLVYLAASVTSYARKQLLFSKAAIERFYGPESGRADCSAKIVYGDTDSIFAEINPRSSRTGERITGREGREASIKLTGEMGKFVTLALKSPHDFEFDKIFDPLLMFSKKRYVGKMFEENADDYVVKPMGIALKRRDNAPIVKTVFKGAMMELLDNYDVNAGGNFVKETLHTLVNGKISLGQLTITKSLRADYANENAIAHKVLANRIAARDPGNAPAAGDRIGYIYIQPQTGQLAAKLQGDRIETPQWVRDKKLVPDYQFYITNQIRNPVCEMFALVVDQLPGFTESHRTYLSGIYDKETRLLRAADIASEILLNGALGVCSKMSKHNFVQTFFGISEAKEMPHNSEGTIATRTRSKLSSGISGGCTKRKLGSGNLANNVERPDNYIMDLFLQKNIHEVRKASKKSEKK